MSSPSPREPAQLVLALEHRPALGAEDYLVSPANAAAVDIIDCWPDWGHPALLIVGPEQSGKTHLANVWRRRSGAEIIAAADLGRGALAGTASRQALVIEDIDRGLADEQLLFHLINMAREERRSLLLTSRQAAGALAIELPDLRSRLRAMPVAVIEPPDEALIQALLVKHLADRQLVVEPVVVTFVARHVERSASAVARVAAALDARALATHRRVTRALASEVLAAIESGEG